MPGAFAESPAGSLGKSPDVEPSRAAPPARELAKAAHVVDVRAAVGGRIVTMGTVAVKLGGHGGISKSSRSLRPGDNVTKGQLLAVVWSPDIGEMKSRFLAAASRSMFDEASLKRLEAQHASAVALAEARRHCLSDRASLARAERSLRRIDDSDELIATLRAAAAEVHREQPDYSRAETWAEFELRAPRAGVLVQVAPGPGGDVEAGAVLFQVVDGKPAPAADDDYLAAEDRAQP